MLKKRNILVAIFSFLFCCSMFAGNVAVKNENVVQNSAYAEDSVFPGQNTNWEGEINSEEDTWWFDGEMTVYLQGSTWTKPLYLPSDRDSLTIDITGQNVIEVNEANAIVFTGSSLTFTGTGSLTLKSATNVFNFNSVAVAKFSDLDVKNESGEDVNLNQQINNCQHLVIGTVAAGPVVEISGEDKETTYDGSRYNLENLFTFDASYAREATYSIVSEGTTGTGTITGCELEITKCGVFNIEISILGTKHTQTLTVNKANLPVGNEEGQVQILVKNYNKSGVEVEKQYSTGWDAEVFYTITALVENNVGGGDVSYSFYYVEEGVEGKIKDGDTLSAAGYEGQNISFDGKYIVRANIAESNLYNSALVETVFYLKKPVTYYLPQNVVNVTYGDSNNGEFDLTTMYQITERCLPSVDSISYKITSDVLDNPLNLNNYIFEITSIEDAVDGDDYLIEVIVNTKEDSVYSSASFTFSLNIKKGNVSGFDIRFISKAFDGEPVKYEIIENVYNLEYTIEYYAGNDNLLASAPSESGKYSAKVTVAGNEVFKETVIVKEFIIGQTVINIIWCEDDFTYNGAVQEISAHYINYEGEEVPLIVMTDKQFKNVQHDGVDYEYNAFVIFKTFDDRYILPDDSVNQHKYHIKPMELEVEVLNRTKAFGSSANVVLDVTVVSGKIFIGDERDSLWDLRIDEDINEETPVGFYEIIATATNSNPNYNVTFTNTAYLRVMNAILSTENMIDDWTWGEAPKTPNAEAAIGEVKFFYFKGETQLQSVPSEPGVYRLVARVGDNPSDPNYAEFEEEFYIYKIFLNVPEEDTNEYVYNGSMQTYRVMDSDLENAKFYTIGNREFKDAGVHQVELKIEDDKFVYYSWPNGQQIYYMNFEIKKKPVSKPEADNRVHKYNGKAITYMLASSEEYRVVSDNTTQTEVGRYRVIVALNDSNNTTWADGTVDNLVYNFVINQGRIDNPVIKDAEGNAINTNDVTIIDVSGNGLNPESILQVDISKSGDEKINKTKTQLKSVLSKYDKIFKVADVKLVQYGVSVQPENRITLKMLVPEELRNANFTLYHIHTNENGEEIISEIEYSKIDKDGFITFQTDKLSSFAFVYEQSSLKASIITFSVLSGIMFVLLIVQLVLFVLKKKSKAKLLAAAAPVFFVKSEVVSTIVLGTVFGLLFVANIVMLVFNILAYKSKKCEEKKAKTKQKSKPAETKKA